jgi:hypothetical protein
VVAHALRTRQDRVVIGHRDARPALDLADPGHQTVGWSACDQLLARAPPLLRGEQQRAVLDERARVHEVVEVLARRPPAELVASRHRLRAPGVEANGMALVHRPEVGALAARLRLGGLARPLTLGGARLEHEQQLALLDRVADGHRDAPDHAVGLCEHLMLHLHRLEDDERRAGANPLVGSVRDRDHDAGELRPHGELRG